MNYDPEDRIRSTLAKRLSRAGGFAVRELRKVVGVQAPLIPGVIPPRAATRATPGAPPRRVSGKGQAGVFFLVEIDDSGARLVFGDDKWYMMKHEFENPPRDHPWLAKSVRRLVPDLVRILKTP